MSTQALKRLRRFANPKHRQEFNARRRSGKPVFNNARDLYARHGDLSSASAATEEKINKHVQQEISEFHEPYAWEKALFLASDEPQAKKDRIDDFVPPPQPRFHLSIEDVIKAEVNDATQQMRNTLYPTEWVKQKLSMVKPEDPDYQYWQKVLSGVNEEDDRAYEEEVGDLAAALRDNYGDEDSLSSVDQELKSARSRSKQEFESKVREVRSVTDEAKKQVEQIAQQNIQQGGSKSLWESKIAQADYLARNDARLQHVFKKAMPEVLERKVNARTFEMFNLDKKFVEQYKDYNRLINQKQHEKQAATEELHQQLANWVDRFRAKQMERNKYIQQHNEYVDWMNAKQDSMTVEEFYNTHPKIWAWVEWRLARHRLDFDKSDEQYARELAYDYSYWPLPRNP